MIFRYGIVGVLLFLGMLSFKGTVCAQESYGKIKCICIDAGHGVAAIIFNTKIIQ